MDVCIHIPVTLACLGGHLHLYLYLCIYVSVFWMFPGYICGCVHTYTCDSCLYVYVCTAVCMYLYMYTGIQTYGRGGYLTFVSM